jgi:hypothetical protein
MYSKCTFSKAIEHGTLPPHPLFNKPGTSGKQNSACYHITEIMPRSKCTVWGWSLSLFVPPTTANFSTSIPLFLPLLATWRQFRYLSRIVCWRCSRAFAWKHAPNSCLLCILVFASRITRIKDDTKLETLTSKYDLYLKMLCPVTKLLLLVQQPSCPISDRK